MKERNITNSGQERSIKARKNIFLMLFIKGVNISISLLYVPLLITTLNTYNYGIWLTVTSIIAWLDLFDIGLGNGLRNKLTESLAKKDTRSARVYISTAYFGIFAFCIFIALVFLIISPHITWSSVLNVPNEMNKDITLLINTIFFFFCVQFVFKIINSILLAFQLPALSSLIIMFGQLLSFILVYIAVFFTSHHSLLDLGIIISISPVLVLAIFTIVIFSGKLKEYKPGLKYIKSVYLKDILGLGIRFFLLQIITLVFYQSSNLIIAHSVGQEGVTEYNIAYKYIGIISMIFTIIVTPYWSATTDAFSKGESEWIRNSVKKLNYIWLVLSVMGVILLVTSKFIYKVWLGNELNVNYSIIGLTLVYFIFNMLYASYGYILNGIGKIKLQMVVTSIVAILYIPLAIALSKRYGVEGVLISMIFVFIINSTWSRLQYGKIISGTATGIWNK
jgi:O-antigen/teichoic acid export membrane protein